jgi:hypothetical protein
MCVHATVCCQDMAPPSHTATASTSTLCKLLTWHQAGVWQAAQSQGAQPGLLHQADWLASLLHGDRQGKRGQAQAQWISEARDMKLGCHLGLWSHSSSLPTM